MDKIIVDGVDVSGCEELSTENDNYCYLNDRLCSNYPNCYYKQLKRKEAECEELKKELLKHCKEFCPECGTEYIYPLGEELANENKKLQQALHRIEDITNLPCINGCKCADKFNVLQIIEGIKES